MVMDGVFYVQRDQTIFTVHEWEWATFTAHKWEWTIFQCALFDNLW
jgi:hypothetical protein